jgi:hypothetical protein
MTSNLRELLELTISSLIYYAMLFRKGNNYGATIVETQKKG